MKNTLKLIGIAALTAIIGFSFITCDLEIPYGGITFNGVDVVDGKAEVRGVVKDGITFSTKVDEVGTTAIILKFSEALDGKKDDKYSGITKSNIKIATGKKADGTDMTASYLCTGSESNHTTDKHTAADIGYWFYGGGVATMGSTDTLTPYPLNGKPGEYLLTITVLTPGAIIITVDGKIASDGTAIKAAYDEYAKAPITITNGGLIATEDKWYGLVKDPSAALAGLDPAPAADAAEIAQINATVDAYQRANAKVEYYFINGGADNKGLTKSATVYKGVAP